MNDNEIIYKGQIEEINRKTQRVSYNTTVFYRVINIDNRYFFAQEISTGTIFPIFNINQEGFKNDFFAFNSQSYLRYGKYFIFAAVLGDNDALGDYYFYPDFQKEFDENPSIEEINKYLKETKKDVSFQNKLEKMEQENNYFCNIDIIKEKIAEARYKSSLEDYSIEDYQTKINLDPIKKLGYDLSLQRNLCNTVGREKEIKKIIKNISIKNKSIMLIGESGSGKTSIVEELALEIKRRTNKWLTDKTIFYLNTAGLVSDTKYVGQFEKKINKLLEFCKSTNGNLILFIDEMHTLYGLGRTEDSSIDAMNILKPYISNGDIIIIGATTKKEYNKYIDQDEAFCRRIEKIEISKPNKDLNIEILLKYIKELENKYELKLSIDNTERVVDYILDITDPKHQRQTDNVIINNPTLAKNIIANAFVEAKYNEQDNVTIEELSMALLECDNLSPTIRKEQARKIKHMISTKETANKAKVLAFTGTKKIKKVI